MHPQNTQADGSILVAFSIYLPTLLMHLSHYSVFWNPMMPSIMPISSIPTWRTGFSPYKPFSNIYHDKNVDLLSVGV